MINNVLIIGTSSMAFDYVQVFSFFNFDITIVGRNELKRSEIEKRFPNIHFESGGIEKYLNNVKLLPDFVVNAVDIINLFKVSKLVIERGVKNLLIEKPGSLQANHLNELLVLRKRYASNVFIGYNRRFYNSVIELRKLIQSDGGIKNVHFEFTEWINTIDPANFPMQTLNKWIYSNSSHVIDLVFSFIGFPTQLTSNISGEGLIPWHKHASLFAGMGVSENNILFTYNSNWCGPGRWSIEFVTLQNRYYLKPMEKLFIQKLNSIEIQEHIFSNYDDLNFKPGLFKQVLSFIKGDISNLVTLEDQLNNFKIFDKIGGYKIN